jgi:hypothetical protein
MTRRTFNFTGRKTIAHKDVRIDVRPDRRFDASWQFDSSLFPPEAHVYLEAFTSGSRLVLRFPFGTVGLPQPPEDRDLSILSGEAVLFNLKVVDESTDAGRLLGIAEHLRGLGEGVTEDASQQALLPVNPIDLDQQVWRLTFEHGRPWLEVNNRIDGIMDIARTDATFFALVYPAVVRAILVRVVVQEEFTDPDADLGDWKTQWLRWAVHWHPDNERPPEGDVSDRTEVWEGWIEAVVEQFCRNHSVSELFAARSAAGAR